MCPLDDGMPKELRDGDRAAPAVSVSALSPAGARRSLCAAPGSGRSRVAQSTRPSAGASARARAATCARAALRCTPVLCALPGAGATHAGDHPRSCDPAERRRPRRCAQRTSPVPGLLGRENSERIRARWPPASEPVTPRVTVFSPELMTAEVRDPGASQSPGMAARETGPRVRSNTRVIRRGG
jgi:hypothetical protein